MPWPRDWLDSCGEDAAAVLAEVDALAPTLPDPARGREDLRTFLEAGGRMASTSRQLRADPKALELLLRLGGLSRYGFETAARWPGAFWQIVQDREYRQVWGGRLLAATLTTELSILPDRDTRIAWLARFKHHHFLRVILGDLAGTLSFPAIVRELSDITDVIAQAALDLALAKLQTRGLLWPEDHPQAPGFTVLGMGKLGGRELNYSSDIDLIFLYEAPEGVREVGGLEVHEWAKRLGAEVIRILDEPGNHGRMYRVDMRLRPEGDRGELALSWRETVDYYYTAGRPWERQAMLKARPIAGSRSLGDRLVAELAPWIFPSDPAWEDLEESRSMRRRIEERAQDANVKTGAGGIRDIEFLVQFFQLAYGGRMTDLRRRDTLPTLALLADHGLLPRPEVRRLGEHLVFLRTLEHRLQMWDDRQEHAVPGDVRERDLLARRLGLADGSALMAKLARVRSDVRAVVARHFLEGSRDQDALLALLVAGEAAPQHAVDVLGPHGFRDPARAAAHLRQLAQEPFFILSRLRTERALVRLLPLLLHLIGETPEPDETLANLVRIVGAVGGRATFFEILAERPEALRLFTDFAGWSHYLAERFADFPGLPDEVMDVVSRKDAKPVQLRAEVRSLVVGLAQPAAPLAHLVAREESLIALRDLDGAPEAVSERLSVLAEATLDVLLSRLAVERGRAWGFPMDEQGRPVRFAILGLGKLGGREPTYASDMDVVFVCDPGGRCPKVDKDGQEFWTRVAQDLMRLTQEHHLWDLDARLRPWGDGGELVASTLAIERYWTDPKDLWERMANLRVAHLAGDPLLGRPVADRILTAALGQPLPADAAAQVRSMRARLEASVAGRDHLKRGWGGYVDHEFIVQYRGLGLDPAVWPRPAGTLACLQALGRLGRIPSEAVTELADGLSFLRFVESRMRLWTGKAVSSLPTDSDGRSRIAKRCHFDQVAAFDERLHLTRETARRWFDRLIV